MTNESDENQAVAVERSESLDPDEPELVVEDTEPTDEDEYERLHFEIASYPADYTVKVLVDKWNSGELVIPEFQRNYVWTLRRASRLIESFLLGLPVPQVFLYKDRTTQKLLVIDGHQRLSTLTQFFSEQFKGSRVFRLQGVHDEWNGKRYSDLGDPDRRRLDDAPLRSIVIQQLDPDDNESIFLVFERLNTGGVTLTPMEIRRTVFHGQAVQFLDELNSDANWRGIIGLTGPDPRFKDVELVLRVLALANRWRDYSKPMKTFLTRHMEQLAGQSEAELGELGETFKEATARTLSALGHKPFHVRARLNLAALDSILAGVMLEGEASSDRINVCRETLLADAAYQEAITVSTSDVQVVKARFEKVVGCLGSGD